jgi:hypothetical protein
MINMALQKYGLAKKTRSSGISKYMINGRKVTGAHLPPYANGWREARRRMDIKRTANIEGRGAPAAIRERLAGGPPAYGS